MKLGEAASFSLFGMVPIRTEVHFLHRFVLWAALLLVVEACTQPVLQPAVQPAAQPAGQSLLDRNVSIFNNGIDNNRSTSNETRSLRGRNLRKERQTKRAVTIGREQSHVAASSDQKSQRELEALEMWDDRETQREYKND